MKFLCFEETLDRDLGKVGTSKRDAFESSVDEPENSMAPAFQQELANFICLLAYRLNCQFIIASHSPFMLSMQGARIYDLDHNPVWQREWYELENMKAYYQLFQRFGKWFEK